MPLIPFATKSGEGEGYSAQRCLNCFVRGTEGVSAASLIGRKGMEAIADLGGPVRDVTEFLGDIYAVAGGRLHRITTAGVVTDLGSVGGTSENVTFAASQSTLSIISGAQYYVWDQTTLKFLVPGIMAPPVWAEFLDGYIIVVGSALGRDDVFQVSNLNDATTFNSLDFAAAESSSDALVGVLADHGELWLFGETSIEVWFNSGVGSPPFQRNQGARIEHGCIDAKTIAKEDNAVFWVGDDLVVYRSTGVAPQVISTREVEIALRKKGVHSAISFDEDGHKFYAVRTQTGTTFCYDITTRQWHERSTGTEDAAWFVTSVTTVGQTQYFGTDTGKIVRFSDGFDDDGATIVTEAISAPATEKDHFTAARVHARVGNGASLATGLGRNPRVMLQTSRNIGASWSTEKWRDMRDGGQYVRPLEWHGLGAFESLTVRLKITDPVNRDIHGVAYDLGA